VNRLIIDISLVLCKIFCELGTLTYAKQGASEISPVFFNARRYYSKAQYFAILKFGPPFFIVLLYFHVEIKVFIFLFRVRHTYG